MQIKRPKAKPCEVCTEKFVPTQLGQKTCSIPCAIKYALDHPVHTEKANARIERVAKRARLRQKREDREKLESKADWMKKAQKSFNAFIRERDKGNLCISCDRLHLGQWHAGHYRTVKAAPELRFDERNCHKQCAPCNDHLSGNILNYRVNLIRFHGLAFVEELEGPHPPKKYTIEDLKEITATYKAKLKALQSKELSL